MAVLPAATKGPMPTHAQSLINETAAIEPHLLVRGYGCFHMCRHVELTVESLN
jgi:hypothetical protein